MGEGWKNFEMHDRKSLDYLEETVARNMDIKSDSAKCSDGNEKYYWKLEENDPCFQVVDDLTKLCSVVRKELVNDETGYLAENFEAQVAV